MYRMLLINPGSTSTKIAVFEDENNVYEKTLRHTAEELAPFPTVASQKDFRKDVIIKFIAESNIDTKFDIIVGRGGMLKDTDLQVVKQLLLSELQSIDGARFSQLLLSLEIVPKGKNRQVDAIHRLKQSLHCYRELISSVSLP